MRLPERAEATGRTVEEAIGEALKELKASRDEVDVEVVEEANKGLFGLIGSRPARVRVTRRVTMEQKIEEAKRFLGSLLDQMGLTAPVETRRLGEDMVEFNIVGKRPGLLIGRRGETLDALQYLVSLAANRPKGGPWLRVVLDTHGYRKRRAQTLERLARGAARRVLETGREIALEPMNALERRIVHMAVASLGGVSTKSEGEEPFRRVVIRPGQREEELGEDEDGDAERSTGSKARWGRDGSGAEAGEGWES